MVNPAGAMALFVLRLAGLISLENAIQDQEANLTQADIEAAQSDLLYARTHLNLSDSDLDFARTFWNNVARNNSLSTTQTPYNVTQSYMDVMNATQSSTGEDLDERTRYGSVVSQRPGSGGYDRARGIERRRLGVGRRMENGSLEPLPTPVALTNSRHHQESLGSGTGGGGGSELQNGEGEDTNQSIEGIGRRFGSNSQSQSTLDSTPDDDSQLQSSSSVHSTQSQSIHTENSHSQSGSNFQSVQSHSTLQLSQSDDSQSQGASTQSPYPSIHHRISSVPRLESLIEGDDVAGIIDGSKMGTGNSEAAHEDSAESQIVHSNQQLSELFASAEAIATISPVPTLSSRSLIGAVPVQPPQQTQHSSDNIRVHRLHSETVQASQTENSNSQSVIRLHQSSNNPNQGNQNVNLPNHDSRPPHHSLHHGTNGHQQSTDRQTQSTDHRATSQTSHTSTSNSNPENPTTPSANYDAVQRIQNVDPSSDPLPMDQNQPSISSNERVNPSIPRPRKLPPARPIPPNHRQPNRSPAEDPQLRNNPYPYGPRLLPGPYAPLTPNLPGGDGVEGDVVEYINYEDEYIYEDQEADPYDGIAVQTREPPVLFVFNKPGYSPQPPTTMGPPIRAPTPSDPWDCAPRCPSYTLLDWNTDYDVRHYPATLWVSTVIISDNRVLAELEGYMRVQDYFYGLNDQGLVINLTVPFVTQIKMGRHPGVLHETNDYTVSLYVQPGYYVNNQLPTPISNEVLVDELEDKTVFVHSFEANVWDVTQRFLEAKVEGLMTQLRQNGEAFLDRYYYLASYSRPELYQTVYYEVWIYATNFRDPQLAIKGLNTPRESPANRITMKTRNKLCRGVECPKFEVLRTYKYGIQKRRYFDGLFASTSPQECQFTTMSVWKGFMPLHLYKHGINSHMEVIEATRPIALVHIRNSQQAEPDCPQNLTMSLYLPHRLHSNPPVTGYAAPSVHITTMEDVIVYAYTVGGYLLEPTRVRQELSDMKYRLSEFGACYKDDEHYVVIYDFIVRYHGRQNEIWIVAENCKATPNG